MSGEGALTAGTSAEPIRTDMLFRRALITHRARFLAVAGAAIVVFGPLALASTAIERWSHQRHDAAGDSTSLAILLGTLVGTSAILFGTAFYAGLLDRIVGEYQHGHARASFGETLRTLPYRRLTAANVLLALVVWAGLLVFVLPGLVALTFFALVGPLINIEHRSVLDAFKRSASLVRPIFWTTFLAITLPIIVEHGLNHAVEEFALEQPGLLASFILGGLTAATVGAFVSLVEVTLTYELVVRDSASDSAHHA